MFEYYFPSNTALITYLVTNPLVRGQGSGIFLGINAWGVMKSLAKKHGHPNPHIIFCEVNDPALISDSEDSLSPLARLRAFQQMGVRHMEKFKYTQPALEGRSERGRDMMLAVVVGPMTPRDEATGASYVETAHVKAFLHDFYSDLGVENLESDKDFQEMMSCLAGKDRVLLRDFDLSRFKPASKKKKESVVVAPLAASSVPVHIVVIGAGLAGLACARMLRDAGFHVTIIEGRNRTGGRIYTGRTFDTRIDLGAAWLHGLEGNPLAEFALANLPDLKMYKNNDQAILLYDRSGALIEPNVVFESYMKFTQLLETLQAEFNPENKDTDADANAADNFESWKRTQPKVAESLQEALKKLYAKHASLHYTSAQEKTVMNFMFSQLESLQGTSMNNLNARDYAHGIEYDGGDNIVHSGFQNVTMMLAQGLDNLHLGHKVERVEYKTKRKSEAPAAAAASSAASSSAPKATLQSLPQVRVFTEKNSLAPIDCHGVVVTSSIGVLQAGMTRFVPELPAWKQDSIRNIGSGLFNKCVLRFDKTFWPASADYIGYNYGSDPPSQEDLSLDAVHAARSNSWFVNYEPVSHVPILIAMMTGPLAEHMETQPDSVVVAEMMRRLRVMFPDAPAQPVDALVTRWGADPYAKGSYSYLKKGGSILDFEAVGAPVDDALFWAGEHTSTDRFGYADGAYVSGQREAKRIINMYAHLGAQPKSKL